MAGAAPGAIMDEDYFGSAAEWGDEADGGQVRAGEGGTGRPRRGLLVSVAGGPAAPPPRGPSTARPAPSRRAPPSPGPAPRAASAGAERAGRGAPARGPPQ